VKQRITIQVNRGRLHTIDAEQDGALAIHPNPKGQWRGWTITHVPTGMQIASTWNRVRARHARIVLNNLPVNWHFWIYVDSINDPEGTTDRLKAAMGSGYELSLHCLRQLRQNNCIH
jgi:hypothetical protein